MESHLSKNESPESDSERNEIRSKLSNMSFEDLQKLKSKIGAKVYREAICGVKSVKPAEFKRENKNRPREASSKVKPNVKTKVKDKRILDPRFDRLCGTFSPKHFENAYGFLSEIRKREKKELNQLLKKETNTAEISKIKYLLQRMENQDREEAKKRREKERREKEKEEQVKALESGIKPYFRTKYEQKIVKLVDKYNDLKKSGKVQKYIEKKQKKLKTKERTKRYFHHKFSDNEGD